MTLIELMISASLSVFVTIMAVMFIQAITVLNIRGIKADDVQTNLNRFLLIMQNYAFYAADVRFAGNVSLDGAASGPGGQGFVRSIDIDQLSDLSGKPSTTLMFFARENTRSRANPMGSNLQSSFLRTAVFYRAPDIANKVPPAMIIHPGNTTGGVSTLNADDSNVLRFENISDVRLDQPQVQDAGGLAVLTSIRMTVKAIFPLANPTNQTGATECYGPTQDITAGVVCQNSFPYKVMQRAIVLHFPNNKRDTFESKFEFPEGFYFFRPMRGM